MGSVLVRWGGFGAVVGVALAILTLKGGAFDWRPILLLGAIGAVIGTCGGVVVRLVAPGHPSPTNHAAIAGCLVGAVVGGAVGATTGLGRPMLALFNPTLPPRDYQQVFGIIGGVVVGAVAGALAGAALSRTLGRKAAPGDAEDSR